MLITTYSWLTAISVERAYEYGVRFSATFSGLNISVLDVSEVMKVRCTLVFSISVDQSVQCSGHLIRLSCDLYT